MTQAATGAKAVSKKETQVQGPTTCLAFSDRAEEAVNFYVSLFRNSRVVSTVRGDGKGPIPKGKLLNATFELNGREFMAFDGGPHFTFTDGISLAVTCETQEEIDEMWGEALRGRRGRAVRLGQRSVRRVVAGRSRRAGADAE